MGVLASLVIPVLSVEPSKKTKRAEAFGLRHFVLLRIRVIKLRLFRFAHKKKALLAQDLFVLFGWIMGFEPTAPGTTNQCSNQLSYTHHIPEGSAKILLSFVSARIMHQICDYEKE